MYFGYLVPDEELARTFLDVYEKDGPDAFSGGDIGVDQGEGINRTDTIFQLREGIERFMITDITNPKASAIAQSQIPILWELPQAKAKGGWVLYLDGHTEWVDYPGKFPMEEGVIERVRKITDAAN